MMPEGEATYRIVHLSIKENKRIQELVRNLASEERIGIDEHIYKDDRAYDRWGIYPFQLFDFMKQILNNLEIKRKELHNTEYFPTRYLCESDLSEYVYPYVIGITESSQGLIVVITILNRKRKRIPKR